MGRENVVKLIEVLYLLYCFYYVCLGEGTLIGCYSALGAPYVSHKSGGARRKSIHPGGGLPDITLAAANHARIETPSKETEVLSAYFSSFCVCISFEVYLIPVMEVRVLFICLW
jgi:hypothetical protein